MNLQVKQRIPLKIKRMGINGEGIGFYKKTLVFVPGALEGGSRCSVRLFLLRELCSGEIIKD